MTATKCRRRNMRAEGCRSCGKLCEAGQGYLYHDTNTTRRNRYTGRFLWFVKCEECHSGNKTRMTFAMDKDRDSRANDPVVRPWSVSQVRKWSVSRVTHEGEVAIRIDSADFQEVVSYRDAINSRFSAPTGYAMEQMEFSGKPLSDKAAADLSGRVLAILVDVQNEEQAAGESAIQKLATAGATVAKCLSGYGWKVEYKGGHYTLFGCVDGKNKVVGWTKETEHCRWIVTTAEELTESIP